MSGAVRPPSNHQRAAQANTALCPFCGRVRKVRRVWDATHQLQRLTGMRCDHNWLDRNGAAGGPKGPWR
jgi:hypothetical protein